MPTTVTRVVVSVRPTVIEQFAVLRLPLTEMSVTTLALAVDTNVAEAVLARTSIRYHAVPSFAIAQLPPAIVTGKKRFWTLAVFVELKNVTVLGEPTSHVPV
jgi:hypothetical protein